MFSISLFLASLASKVAMPSSRNLSGRNFLFLKKNLVKFYCDAGIYEMINMAARFVGVGVVLVSPIKRIKLTYLVFLSFQVVAYLMICAIHFAPSLFDVFFPTANFFIGIGTGIFMFPYLLLYKCFKD